jgi:hypothetical protein
MVESAENQEKISKEIQVFRKEMEYKGFVLPADMDKSLLLQFKGGAIQ